MGWDRVIRFAFQNQKIWEEKNHFYLYCELTGRNANCILTTADDPPSILGCQKTVVPNKTATVYYRWKTLPTSPQKNECHRPTPLDTTKG
jgi:predicted ribosome quality control (RQC) complex YloA/Tae2 family protein